MQSKVAHNIYATNYSYSTTPLLTLGPCYNLCTTPGPCKCTKLIGEYALGALLRTDLINGFIGVHRHNYYTICVNGGRLIKSQTTMVPLTTYYSFAKLLSRLMVTT